MPGFNPFRGFAVAENNRRYITGNVINPQNFAPSPHPPPLTKGIRTSAERAVLASICTWPPPSQHRLTTPDDEVCPGTQTFAYCRNETTTRPLNARLPANFTLTSRRRARVCTGRERVLDAINNSSVQRAPSKRKFATTDWKRVEGCAAGRGVVSPERFSDSQRMGMMLRRISREERRNEFCSVGLAKK